MFTKQPTYSEIENDLNVTRGLVSQLEKKIDLLNITAERKALEIEIANNRIEAEHIAEITKMNHEKDLLLKKHDFEIKHFKDDEIAKLRATLAERDSKIGVLENQVKMLDTIVDLNADIVDVKDLIGSLIKKLPEINLTSLTVNGSNKS